MTKRIVAAAVLVAAFALGSAGAASAQNGKDCKLVKVAELPLRFEDNQPMVQVAINGKPAWFLIDTGAHFSEMFGGAAKAYDITQISENVVRFYGAGGEQDARQVIVSELGLGAMKVKDVPLLSLNRNGSPDFAGRLGRNFLGRLGDIEFDLADGALRFWRADHCEKRSLAYWTKAPAMAELDHFDDTDRYIVKVRLNGRSVDAELSSGSRTTVVTPGMARQAGAASDKIADFDSVAVGQEEVKHTHLRVYDIFGEVTAPSTGSKLETRPTMLNAPDMLLGADFLRSHRVLIAASQGLLYFTYSGGPIFEVVGDAVKPKDAPPEPTPTPTPAAK